MSNLQTQLNTAVASFVAQISTLAKQAALDSLEGAFGAHGKASRRSPGLGMTVKRTADDLEALGNQFRDYVAKHPGLRIEQINRELGTTTGDLALPIRKMIAEGAIKTKGQKRSTTYFAGESKKKS